MIDAEVGNGTGLFLCYPFTQSNTLGANAPGFTFEHGESSVPFRPQQPNVVKPGALSFPAGTD